MTRTAQQDLQFITQNIRSEAENLLVLRPTLESALFQMGHSIEAVREAVEQFYKRTLH